MDLIPIITKASIHLFFNFKGIFSMLFFDIGSQRSSHDWKEENNSQRMLKEKTTKKKKYVLGAWLGI
jgi:hypothetical protein